MRHIRQYNESAGQGHVTVPEESFHRALLSPSRQPFTDHEIRAAAAPAIAGKGGHLTVFFGNPGHQMFKPLPQSSMALLYDESIERRLAAVRDSEAEIGQIQLRLRYSEAGQVSTIDVIKDDDDYFWVWVHRALVRGAECHRADQLPGLVALIGELARKD